MEVLAILTDRYEAIAANPPYMGQGNMNGELKNYVNTHYPLSKSDLFAVFMEVCLSLNIKHGLMGMINQHSWMFLSSYEKLRLEILKNYGILSMLHLGPRTFEELSGEVVQSTAFILTNDTTKQKGCYFRLIEYKNNDEKEANFLKRKNGFYNIQQNNFIKIPGSPIAYWVSEKTIQLFENEKSISHSFKAGGRIKTHDNNKFLREFWEIDKNQIGRNLNWLFVENGGEKRKWFGNRQTVVNWSKESINFYEAHGGLSNPKFWQKEAITWSIISSRGASFRYKDSNSEYTSAAPTIIPTNNKTIYYTLAFLNTKYVGELLKVMNPTINTTSGDVITLPLICNDPDTISIISKDSVLYSKKDWDSRETSWDFQLSPLLNPSDLLDQAYANWAQKASADFYQLHANEEELNRLFIDIYDLNEELDPLVPLKDITILQDELDTKTLEKTEQALRQRRQWKLTDGKWVLHEDESVPLPALPIKRDVVMKQFISYAIGCMMGRYRLDQPGLHIAHPNPSSEEVCTYMFNSQTIEIDDDAIIPLMGSNCTFADDAVNRFNHFLEVIWGAEPLTQNKNFLQECLDQEIEKYLVNSFWKDHCRTYKKKPIYWLFSSEKGAFQVLVYMHRMNRFTAEKIRSKYLLKHLQFLQQEIDRLDVNTGKSREEQKRLDSLRNQYGECQRYEMLLKDCADRQIEFDLDDGVTANYELFKGVVAPIK